MNYPPAGGGEDGWAELDLLPKEAGPTDRRALSLLRVNVANWAVFGRCYMPMLATRHAAGMCQRHISRTCPHSHRSAGHTGNHRRPIVELTAQGLGNRPVAQQWRNLVAVDLSFYKSPLSEEIRDEGRVESRAEDILLVLEQRGIDVPDEARERITGCEDPAILRRWLARAVTSPSAGEIFADE